MPCLWVFLKPKISSGREAAPRSTKAHSALRFQREPRVIANSRAYTARTPPIRGPPLPFFFFRQSASEVRPTSSWLSLLVLFSLLTYSLDSLALLTSPRANSLFRDCLVTMPLDIGDCLPSRAPRVCSKWVFSLFRDPLGKLLVPGPFLGPLRR